MKEGQLVVGALKIFQKLTMSVRCIHFVRKFFTIVVYFEEILEVN